MAGLLAAFASCTQDDVSAPVVGTVPTNSTLSVELPERGLRTRALPTTEDHTLRCILEVWSQGDAPALQHRQVLTAGDADDGGTLTFNFDIDPGTYDCLLWAEGACMAMFKISSMSAGETFLEESYILIERRVKMPVSKSINILFSLLLDIKYGPLVQAVDKEFLIHMHMQRMCPLL